MADDKDKKRLEEEKKKQAAETKKELEKVKKELEKEKNLSVHIPNQNLKTTKEVPPVTIMANIPLTGNNPSTKHLHSTIRTYLSGLDEELRNITNKNRDLKFDTTRLTEYKNILEKSNKDFEIFMNGMRNVIGTVSSQIVKSSKDMNDRDMEIKSLTDKFYTLADLFTKYTETSAMDLEKHEGAAAAATASLTAVDPNGIPKPCVSKPFYRNGEYQCLVSKEAEKTWFGNKTGEIKDVFGTVDPGSMDRYKRALDDYKRLFRMSDQSIGGDYLVSATVEAGESYYLLSNNLEAVNIQDHSIIPINVPSGIIGIYNDDYVGGGLMFKIATHTNNPKNIDFIKMVNVYSSVSIDKINIRAEPGDIFRRLGSTGKF